MALPTPRSHSLVNKCPPPYTLFPLLMDFTYLFQYYTLPFLCILFIVHVNSVTIFLLFYEVLSPRYSLSSLSHKVRLNSQRLPVHFLSQRDKGDNTHHKRGPNRIPPLNNSFLNPPYNQPYQVPLESTLDNPAETSPKSSLSHPLNPDP